MGNTTVETLRGVIKDTWAPGVPRDMYNMASPAFMMLAKEHDASWQGGSTEGGVSRLVYNYGIRSNLPGAGTSTYSTSWAAPGNSNNDKVEATPSRYYTTLKIDHDALDAASTESAEEVLIASKALESEGHVLRTMNVLSKEYLSNGGGVIGRMSGTGAALTGTTLTVKNRRDIINFEPGDRVQFASTNGLSGSVKAVVSTVVSTNRGAGTVTITPALVGGDGVLDNDFIFRDGRFGAAFSGLFAWCPTSSDDLSTSFYGINQTSGKLGGHRITLKPGGDPVSKVLRMLQRADEESAEIDCILANPSFIRKLLESSRFQSFSRISEGAPARGNPLADLYRMRGMSADMVRQDSVGLMRFGVDGHCFRWPSANKDVYLYGDKYLTDSSALASDDDLMVGYSYNDMKMPVLKNNGFGWQDHDSNGPLYQVQGNSAVGGVYAARGQFVCMDPNNLIVAGSNVVE